MDTMQGKRRRPEWSAPLYIAWEATLQCNARCLQCYSESGPGVRHPEELSTEQALRMIDELADAGLLVLAFSGGEPLMRRDIYQLMSHAAERGLVVNVATNGAIINDRTALRMKQSGVRSVTVSLDGATAEMHDHIRQCPGLFEKTVRAVRTLVRYDHRVVVSFTPTVLNHHQGRDVVALAYNLGASAVNMSEYVPAGRGTHDLALPPDVLRDVVGDWIAMRREYAGRLQIIWHDCRVALLVPEEERDRYSGCGAGKLTARIRVDGVLTPCVFLPNPAGDLRTTSFREVWQTSPLLAAIRDRETLQGGNCGSCEHRHICGGCRAVSMSYTGNPLMGDRSCWIVPEDMPAVECGPQAVQIVLPS